MEHLLYYIDESFRGVAQPGRDAPIRIGEVDGQ